MLKDGELRDPANGGVVHWAQFGDPTGQIITFNKSMNRTWQKVEKYPIGNEECDKYVTEFRKNVSKDYPIWNQHR